MRARAFNQIGAFEKALETIKRVEKKLEEGKPAAVAKLYFEMSRAYLGLQEYAKAKTAREKADVGTYRKLIFCD